MTERDLMRRIKTQWGATINAQCALSSIPAPFIAALIAGESSGIVAAKRFEPAVYRHLLALVTGTRTRYGSITQSDLAIEESQMQRDPRYHELFFDANSDGISDLLGSSIADAELRELATSWGLSQVMGYHTIDRPEVPKDLLDPDKNIHIALQLLTEFADHYGLDVRKEFEEMFRCWNGGSPTASTFSFNYVPNGLRRMEIYKSL